MINSRFSSDSDRNPLLITEDGEVEAAPAPAPAPAPAAAPARAAAEVGVVDGALTRELRRSVLRDTEPDEPLPGDDQPGAVHFAAVDPDGTPVSTCFVYADPCPWLPGRPAWHLRQLATRPDRRGAGLGAAVVTAAAEHVAAQGADVLWCNARETAVGFYARQGYRRHGEVFTDERHTIPHVRMWRELRAAPTASS